MKIADYVKKFGLCIGTLTFCGLSYLSGCGKQPPVQLFDYDKIHQKDLASTVTSYGSPCPLITEEKVREVEKAQQQLRDIWYNTELSSDERTSRIMQFQQSLDQEVALQLIRIIPVQDPETKQFIPFDSYMRAMVWQAPELKGTRIRNDPVGMAFDLLVGNYTPLNFARDYTSLTELARQEYCSGIPTSGLGNVTKDPKNPGWYQDKDGNLWPESTIRKQRQEYDELTRKGATKQGGMWIMTEDKVKQQGEEERKKKKR